METSERGRGLPEGAGNLSYEQQRGGRGFREGLRERMGASNGGWDCSEGNRGSVGGQELTEGRQGSGERDEGWRLGEGTWPDSGPSSKFGSSQGQVLRSHSEALGSLWSTWAKGLFSWAFSCSKNLSSPWALTMRSDSSEKSTASPSKATRS